MALTSLQISAPLSLCKLEGCLDKHIVPSSEFTAQHLLHACWSLSLAAEPGFHTAAAPLSGRESKTPGPVGKRELGFRSRCI